MTTDLKPYPFVGGRQTGESRERDQDFKTDRARQAAQ